MPLSTAEFAAKIKAKYPQYQNVDDSTLVDKITTKYPQYKSQVSILSTQPQQSQSWWDSVTKPRITNEAGQDLTPEQTKEFLSRPEVKDEFKAKTENALMPAFMGGGVGVGAGKGALNTVKGIGSIGATLIGQGDNYNKTMQPVTDYLKPKGLEQQVGYTGEQTGEFMAPGGLVAKGTKAINGALKGAGIGEKAVKAGTFAAGILGDAAAASGVNAVQEGRLPTAQDLGSNALWGLGTAGVGAAIKGVGKGFLNQLLGATKNEKAVLEKRGVDIYKSLANDVGFVVTKKGMQKKAEQAIKKYSPQLDDVIKNLDDAGVRIKPTELTKNLRSKDLAKELGNIIETTTLTGRTKVLKDIEAEVNAAIKKIGKKQLTVKRLNELKKMFDKPVNWNKLNPADKATVAVDKIIADNARRVLDGVSKGEITRLNAKISPLLTAAKLAKKGEYSKTLGDIISGSSGFGAGGIKGAITGVAAQRILRHPATQSLLGVTGYKLGSFLKSAKGRNLILGATNQVINQ